MHEEQVHSSNWSKKCKFNNTSQIPIDINSLNYPESDFGKICYQDKTKEDT